MYSRFELYEERLHSNVTSELFRLPQEFTAFEGASDGGARISEPRPLMPRPRERVLADRTDLASATGEFYLENVMISRSLDGVKPGTVKKLMVMESLPKPINYTGGMDPLSYGGTFTLTRMLGTVPVEDDGSAYFRVPALRAVFFIALDAEGRAVKRMQSFTQVMPGERQAAGVFEQRELERLFRFPYVQLDNAAAHILMRISVNPVLNDHLSVSPFSLCSRAHKGRGY